jgi:hypothetical protein
VRADGLPASAGIPPTQRWHDTRQPGPTDRSAPCTPGSASARLLPAVPSTRMCLFHILEFERVRIAGVDARRYIPAPRALPKLALSYVWTTLYYF